MKEIKTLDKDKLFDHGTVYDNKPCYRFGDNQKFETYLLPIMEAEYYPHNKELLIRQSEKVKKILFLRNYKQGDPSNPCPFTEKQVIQLMKDLNYYLITSREIT